MPEKLFITTYMLRMNTHNTLSYFIFRFSSPSCLPLKQKLFVQHFSVFFSGLSSIQLHSSDPISIIIIVVILLIAMNKTETIIAKVFFLFVFISWRKKKLFILFAIKSSLSCGENFPKNSQKQQFFFRKTHPSQS